jgi:hypothetical protein
VLGAKLTNARGDGRFVGDSLSYPSWEVHLGERKLKILCIT